MMRPKVVKRTMMMNNMRLRLGMKNKSVTNYFNIEHYETLYKRPNATERLMERLEGKTDKEINAQFSKRAYMIKQ